MKQVRQIMGMPITIEIIDLKSSSDDFDQIFSYFKQIDQRFSPYKKDSEISKINEGTIKKNQLSPQMKKVFKLSEKTKQQTHGYFNIQRNGRIDPSGLVKGWAIQNAAQILTAKGFKNFYIEAGGDIQVSGKNSQGKSWKVGIRNPFNLTQIVKVLTVENRGVATSGTYERGKHIYNPYKNEVLDNVVSLTVIGPNIYQADRFATAAFAMGKSGIEFIEKLQGFEGYMIDKTGLATMTSGFKKYA